MNKEEWKPWATVPLELKPVLAYFPEGTLGRMCEQISVVSPTKGMDSSVSLRDQCNECEATHWMPLPEAPMDADRLVGFD